MAFVLPLTETDRRGKIRVGPKKLLLMQNRAVAAREHAKLLPAGFDLGKFDRDTASCAALIECLAGIDKMRSAVSDTLLALGDRVWAEGAAAYAHIKLGSASSERLKRSIQRLISHRSVTTEPAVPTAPAAPAAPATGTVTPPAVVPLPPAEAIAVSPQEKAA